MKVHPEKCTVIRISTNRRHIIKTNFQIHGHSLEIVNSCKYLGIDLTRRKHIESTVNKANKTLGFIRRNLGYCTTLVKSAAYTTLVRPVLEYSSTVLGSSSIDRHSQPGTSSAQGSQIRAPQLHRTNSRMCHQHGPEPRMGVPPTKTLPGQASYVLPYSARSSGYEHWCHPT